MSPFVNDDLLVKGASGNVSPKPNIDSYPINKVLADLHQNDLDYGLHAIDNILDSLRGYCRALGYSLAMGPNELLDATLIKTLKSLATWVQGACSPLKVLGNPDL